MEARKAASSSWVQVKLTRRTLEWFERCHEVTPAANVSCISGRWEFADYITVKAQCCRQKYESRQTRQSSQQIEIYQDLTRSTGR